MGGIAEVLSHENVSRHCVHAQSSLASADLLCNKDSRLPFLHSVSTPSGYICLGCVCLGALGLGNMGRGCSDTPWSVSVEYQWNDITIVVFGVSGNVLGP